MLAAGGVLAEPAATWAVEVLRDGARWTALGQAGRALAEREFALEGCADKFEHILTARL